MKHNKVKNPSGQEANQLAILNSGRAPAGGRRAANLIGPRDQGVSKMRGQGRGRSLSRVRVRVRVRLGLRLG